MSSEVQRYITGIMTPVEMANPGPASISARQTVVVTYEDYAALEAENARLTAQLAAIQGGMGEVVGFDRNAAYASCPESGCDWGSFYVGWKAAAAQHQRIVAALSAQQSAPERVSVPVELAERVTTWREGDEGDSGRSELRALLASHGRGEA